MKDLSKLVIFLIYTLSIFMMQSHIWLIMVTIINLLLIKIFQIGYRKAMSALVRISIIVLITVMFNIIFADIQRGMLIGVRLLLVCNATYIFSNIYSYTNLANSVEKLSYPIKFIRR